MTQQSREVESEERRYNCAKVSRKKIHRREMSGKVWAGSKSTLGKAAGAEVAVERRHANLHAAVARSTFSSKMPLSQAAYIARMFVPLLEVAMWKNCTPLWREAHFQVKIVRN